MSDQSETITTVTTVTTEPVEPAGAVEALKAEEAGGLQAFNVRDSEFHVVADLPGIVLLDMGVAADPSATSAEQLRAVRQFLKAAVPLEEQVAFEALLRNAQPVIKIDELNKVVEQLIGIVGGRPTQ